MSSAGVAFTLENLVYEKKGAIAYATLNRPRVLNALNQATWENVRTAFEGAREPTSTNSRRSRQSKRKSPAVMDKMCWC